MNGPTFTDNADPDRLRCPLLTHSSHEGAMWPATIG